MKTRSIFIGLIVMAALTGSTRAQSYDLSWHTLDGGGAMFSTGGVYSLGGTIGQADASSFAAPMTGGGYTLVGGFWTVGSLPSCSCLGDMNADGLKNGGDIQQFARCVVGSGPCDCADVDGTPGVSSNDVTVFVASLLAGATCP